MNLLLEQVFRECFLEDYRTVLLGGAEEPLYQPAPMTGELHRIFYRHDYAASALHEVAHWCIAGPARRTRLDYGYWYAPDGRDASQQRAFEQVEVKPQALEWHFARACDRDFRLSADNLDGESGNLAVFAAAVREQARRYCAEGLPPRAARFRDRLSARFRSGALPDLSEFSELAA